MIVWYDWRTNCTKYINVNMILERFLKTLVATGLSLIL